MVAVMCSSNPSKKISEVLNFCMNTLKHVFFFFLKRTQDAIGQDSAILEQEGLFIQYDCGSYKKKQTSENIVTGMTSCDHEGIDLRCVFVTHIWNARGWL